MEKRINGSLAALLALLFFLAVYLFSDKIVWIMDNFLRGLAAIKG